MMDLVANQHRLRAVEPREQPLEVVRGEGAVCGHDRERVACSGLELCDLPTQCVHPRGSGLVGADGLCPKVLYLGDPLVDEMLIRGSNNEREPALL